MTPGAPAPHASACWVAFRPAHGSRGGWHLLSITTSEDFGDEQQALALGFLEGWLTGVGRAACECMLPAHINAPPSCAPGARAPSCTALPACSGADCGAPHQRLAGAQLDGRPAAGLVRCSRMQPHLRRRPRSLASKRCAATHPCKHPPAPTPPPSTCRLERQDYWTRRQAARNSTAFWAAMCLLHAQACAPAALPKLKPSRCPALPCPYAPLSHLTPPRPPQMDGMRMGYAERAEHERGLPQQAPPGGSGAAAERLRLPPLGRRDFLWMSAVGDLGDLREALAAPGDAAAGGRWDGWGAVAGCPDGRCVYGMRT